MISQEIAKTPTDMMNGSAGHDEILLAKQRQMIIRCLGGLRPDTDAYATEFVDQLLQFASRVGTSDIHLQPTLRGFEIRFRSDGVLQKLGEFPSGASSSIVSRLKVLSNLLTYRSDIPQEGRIASPVDLTEVRVSTYPTLHGERAVMRFFGNGRDYQTIDQLGHTPDVTQAIKDTLAETSGAMIVAGPAGSGKSTTLYACATWLNRPTVLAAWFHWRIRSKSRWRALPRAK